MTYGIVETRKDEEERDNWSCKKNEKSYPQVIHKRDEKDKMR